MQIGPWTTTVLLSLSSLLGIHSVPNSADMQGGWSITQEWKRENGVSSFEAQSSKVIEQCAAQEAALIQFPTVVHGAHEIYLDGVKISEFGDPKFKSVLAFYASPEVPCSMVKGGKVLKWRAYCYSEYFARASNYPYVTSSSYQSLFTETFNLIAAGCLAILAVFTLVLFWGRIPTPLTLSVACGAFGFAVYFFGSATGYYNLKGSMLQVHKVADFGVWVGLALFYNSLRMTQYLNPTFYWVYLANILIALVFILFGVDGDMVQFGTTLPFGGTILVNLACEVSLIKNQIKSGLDRRGFFVFVSLTIFLIADVNEIFVVTGLLPSYTIFNLGAVGGITFFVLYVNERISQTYRERDFLQSNLEKEVERKTQELKSKSEVLETTLSELKTAQADLVQSAKLASLGTLSAGIAHEINNSLNYVYGSLKPLERLVEKGMSPDYVPKTQTLFKIMNEGLQLTFNIIKSLKNYSGLNQAEFNDLELNEVFDSVLTILKSRIPENIEIIRMIDPGVTLYGSIVGLNQVFMNLITNAIDAMPQGGRIEIKASRRDDRVVVTVADTGTGMPEKVLSRIFEPFFTTKGVGKGTGLGLHIVKSEVERQGGKISVRSQVGVGTEFTLDFSVTQIRQERAVV